jgi:hypothetical protein
VLYLCIVFCLALTEILLASLAPQLGLEWRRPGYNPSLLKDAASYYISAQVGALGIVSIAIGLVTLIAQRQNARREIQIYYHESLAQEVVASSVALLVVLCIQIFWPLETLIRFLRIGIPSNTFEVALTAIHTAWLAINLSALAHFVALSLGFVQPNERENIRRRYTANWVIPNDLTERLLRARYIGASLSLSPEEDASSPIIAFGYELGDSEEVELQSSFRTPTLLYDVRMKLLSWAIRRWQHRCQFILTNVGQRQATNDRSRLVFKPSFDRALEGTVIWCTRHGGVSLTPFERLLIRWSFRFKKAENET